MFSREAKILNLKSLKVSKIISSVTGKNNLINAYFLGLVLLPLIFTPLGLNYLNKKVKTDSIVYINYSPSHERVFSDFVDCYRQWGKSSESCFKQTSKITSSENQSYRENKKLLGELKLFSQRYENKLSRSFLYGFRSIGNATLFDFFSLDYSFSGHTILQNHQHKTFRQINQS